MSTQSKLRQANEEYTAEARKRQPNPGALQRMARTIRKLEARLLKEREKQAKAIARKKEKPRTPLVTKSVLKSKTQLQANAPIKPVNRERRAKLREEQFSIADGYHAHIISLPCIRCAKAGPSDPAHMRDRSVGGKADTILPLCRMCHTWQEVNGKAFEQEFHVKHHCSPLAFAAALRYAYLIIRE